MAMQRQDRTASALPGNVHPPPDGDALPKLSVIITCYNYQDYVAQAIESVLSQDCKPYEIIVVDDGSTDGSRDVIARYASRVTVMHIPNQGSARACLRGVAASSGDFIQFLDADDFLNPGAIAQILSNCRPGVAKLQFPVVPVNAKGAVIGDPNPALTSAAQSHDLIQQINTRGSYDTPPTSGNVFSRRIFDYVGDLPYERGIDGITYLIAPFIGDVVTIKAPLASYRVHDRNKSNFATLSANRFDAEADRYITRLKHLAQICKQEKLPGLDIAAKLDGDTQFSYVLEKRILSELAKSQRPSLRDLFTYVRAVRSERFSLARTMLTAGWAAALVVTPMSYLKNVAILRANPWTRGPLWAWVKRKTVGVQMPGANLA